MIYNVIQTHSDVPENNNEYRTSMQQCSMHLSDPSDIPWILQEGAFLHSSFWWESFLNISNHWPMKWPKIICIFGLYDLVKLFDLSQQYPGWHNYPVLTSLAVKMSNSLSLLIYFTEIRPVLVSLTSLTLKLLTQNLYLSDLIMPKPVFLMTVQEAHKEYNSLIDQIRAKYELLDSGECGSVGTPVLAHLMVHMSKLCRHLNLPMPKELHRIPHFKHWSALNSKFYICGRFG